MPLDLIGFAAPEKDLGLADSPTIFPVEVRNLLASEKLWGDKSETPDCGDTTLSTHKCIFRTDTGESVGVVGANYRLLRNETYFATIEEAMRSAISEEMWEGVQVRDRISRGGSYCTREYVFPAYARALANTVHETSIGLRVIGSNSYDGGSSARLMTGLIDFYCTNGLVLGKNIAKHAMRHSANMDPRSFVVPLRRSIEQTEEMVDEVGRMARTPITMDQATELLEQKFSGRRSGELLKRFNTEVEQRGMNAFALLSALTYYSSHDSEEFPTLGRPGTSPEILAGREDEVQRVVASREFRSLLEAA